MENEGRGKTVSWRIMLCEFSESKRKYTGRRPAREAESIYGRATQTSHIFKKGEVLSESRRKRCSPPATSDMKKSKGNGKVSRGSKKGKPPRKQDTQKNKGNSA